MSSHEKADFQILLDKASNYIVTHASAAAREACACGVSAYG